MSEDDVASLIGIVILLVVTVGAPIWVYKDANQRGRNGGLWAVMTFFFLYITFPIYICVRKPKGDLSR